MAIHHNVVKKAERHGLVITESYGEFIVTKDGVEVARDIVARTALEAAVLATFTHKGREAAEPETQDEGETDMAKTTKTAKKAGKKAARKARAAVATGKTIVRDEYRKNYNKDDNCGDAIAVAMTAYLKPGKDGKVGKVLDMDRLKKLAEDNDIQLSRWAALNNGQKSMNLRNVLRARAKKGDKVKIAGRIFE